MRLPPFPALEARSRRVISRAAPLLILILLGPAAAAARQAPGPVPQSAGSDAAATKDALHLIEAQQKANGQQPRDLESLTHQLEERGAPAQPQQPAQESRDQLFFIKIPGTDAAFKISGFGIDFARLNTRVDTRQPLIPWSWAAVETVKVAFAFENPDSEMTGAARVNNRRVATLDIQPGSARSITRRYPGNVIWLPVPRLEFIARTLYGARVNKDGHSLTAGQTQIGATFRF
jgi:hypothetical protein